MQILRIFHFHFNRFQNINLETPKKYRQYFMIFYIDQPSYHLRCLIIKLILHSNVIYFNVIFYFYTNRRKETNEQLKQHKKKNIYFLNANEKELYFC